MVEDDSSMTHAIERLLQVAGFQARSFTSAESLLRSGAAPDAACFVFDIHLPGLSGLELCQRLVENGIKRPVIFITAHDEPLIRNSAEQFGAATWLIKPFPGRSLLDAVRRAIQPS
ncbi:MAG: response regulator [Synechococcaceae cyanobacterium]|nr:response regulator [Synechococcaceae cyanobacterium]